MSNSNEHEPIPLTIAVAERSALAIG